jgi:hypothetical protein
MKLQAQQDLAMILPLPVPAASVEGAVRFIDLQAYPEFFQHLKGIFAPEYVQSDTNDLAFGDEGTLMVHEVGLFEASFVPSVADFCRLDPRFRLPASIWDRLPQIRDWGFAVFKLNLARPLENSQSSASMDEFSEMDPVIHNIHPMAFEFPRRNCDHLFFPTLHIHDGQVHPTAEFNHIFYCQLENQPPVTDSFLGTEMIQLKRWNNEQRGAWDKSPRPLPSKVDISRTAGVLDADKPIYRQIVQGFCPNEDIILRLGG